MKYNFDLDLSVESSLGAIIDRIERDSVVLEFGCANGRMSRYLKEELGCKVYAVEIDKEAALDAKEYCEEIVIGDIESFGFFDKFRDFRFDYIVFADVLEHLFEPWRVLRKSKELLKDDGSVLISVPNIAHNAVLIELLKGEFNYREVGLLDDTHIRFFTKSSFERLFCECGYESCFTKEIKLNPKHSEFANSYEELPYDVGKFLQERVFGEVYQYVYELKSKKNNSDICSFDDKLNINFSKIIINEENFLTKEVVLNSNKQRVVFNLDEFDSIDSLKIFLLNDNFSLEELSVWAEYEDRVEKITDSFDSVSVFKSGNRQFFTRESYLWRDKKGRWLFEGVKRLILEMKFFSFGSAALIEMLKVLKGEIKNISESQKKLLEEKDKTIEELNRLAHSLRLKNRAKRVIKRVLPNFAIKIIKHVKSNPQSFKKVIYMLKSGQILELVRKFGKVGFGSNEVVEYVFKEEPYEEQKNFLYRPLISVVMPVYNVEPKWLKKAIASIEKQWYDNWELCICDDGSSNRDTLEYLSTLKNEKIKIEFLDKNVGIAGASNRALELACGEYVLLMDNDDEITPNALHEVVKILNSKSADLIYSDEDKIDENGIYSEPYFKPDFSEEMFLSQNYINHLCVIKKSLLDRIGGWREGFDGAQDYDLYLRVMELSKKIEHIPKVLYHWRKIDGSAAKASEEKPKAWDAGVKALESYMEKNRVKASVSKGDVYGTYRVAYKIRGNPLIDIIVPFKDKSELLRVCVESVLKSSYKNFRIIGISNNSKERATFEEMDRLRSLDERVQFYEYNVPFNYSRINNYAIERYVKGEYIVLLNNDIEIINSNWIEEMLMYAQRDEIGCVGAKLLYPNNTIQHGGVIVGLGGVAGHSHKYFPKDSPGYFGRLKIVQNFSAVTAACLMVKKSIYEDVGGLDEVNLKVAFNDVDFCLRVMERGYRNVFTPYAVAYHHESISRGVEDSFEKIKRFNSEIDYMKKRHKKILQNGDRFYNPNLTQIREDFSLR